MGAGRTSSVAHITDPLAARDPLALVHADRDKMRIARLDAELVLDLDQRP
jgi:hypothetical protein